MTFGSELDALIDKLVQKVVNTTKKRQIDSHIAEFYKALDGLTRSYKEEIIKEATQRALDLGLSKQNAIRIAHIRNIISSRYDKDGKLIRTAYDIVQAFNDVPKNITKDIKSIIVAWKLETDKYVDLGSRVRHAGVSKRAKRNYKTLRDNWKRQSYLDARFEKFPKDAFIMFIAQPEEERREQVCHTLHGTIWKNKGQIPEWAKPLIHLNCRCELVEQKNVVNETVTVAGVLKGRKCTKPDWLKSGQGISNIKKVKGECAYTYVTLVEKGSRGPTPKPKPKTQGVKPNQAQKTVDFGYPNGRFNNYIDGIDEDIYNLIGNNIKPKAIRHTKRAKLIQYLHPSQDVLHTTKDKRTFLHEYGHFIDHIYGVKHKHNWGYSYNLLDALEEDLKIYSKHEKKKTKQGRPYVVKKYAESIAPILVKLYTKEGTRWKIKNKDLLAGVSDIYDALFDGYLQEGNFGVFGHGVKYYNKVGHKTQETFANLFSAYATGGDDWELMQDHFPNLSKRFKEIITKELK